MRILDIVKKEDNGKFFLDEFTTQFGSIHFVLEKGGSISNCYFYRFNKTIDTKRDKNGNVLYEEGSFIDFYINKVTHRFQHIEFPSLRLFEFQIDHDLKFIDDIQEYYTPIIDISTWVSPFGRLRSYSSDDIKYLNSQDNINVKIIHNRGDIIRFLFGEIVHTYAMNENLSFSVDSRDNLSAITIRDAIEVKKLTSMF